MVICGRSGSGKSTLVMGLMRMARRINGDTIILVIIIIIIIIVVIIIVIIIIKIWKLRGPRTS